MESNKNLSDLLAAISNGTPPPNNAAATRPQPSTSAAAASDQPPPFSPASQLPIPPISAQMSRPSSSLHSTASAPPNVNGHYNELLNLLQNSAAPSVNPQHSAPTNTVAQSMPASHHMSYPHQKRPTPNQAMDQKARVALKRQRQIQVAQAQHRREALSSADSVVRPTHGLSTNFARMARPGFSTSMQSVINQQNVPTNSRPDSKQPQQRHTTTGLPHSRQNTNPQMRQGTGHAQNASITQEQVIVGHFCRHAIKTLAKIMENNPFASQVDARLREHIKAVWSQWVKGAIQRPHLLQSVSNFVKESTPAAKDVDVITGFKKWYEREYEMQRQRGMERTRQNPQSQIRAAQQPASSRALPRAGNVPNSAANRQVSRGNMSSSPVRGPVKLQPQQLSAKLDPSAQRTQHTAGKTVAAKLVPGRGMPAVRPGVIMKAVAGRGAAVKTVAGKSVGGKSISRAPAIPKPGPVIDGSQLMQQNIARNQRGAKAPTVARVSEGPILSLPKAAQPSLSPTANKSIVGSKSLPGNKSIAQPKGKQSKKLPPKNSPKTANKAAPKEAEKGLVPPSFPFQNVVPGNGSMQMQYSPNQAKPTMQGIKRAIDVGSSGSPPSASKKGKGTPKQPKGTANKKKLSPTNASVGGAKSARAPVPRPDQKGRNPKAAAGAASFPQNGNLAKINAPQGMDSSAVKRVRRSEDLKEISLVDKIVDIEDEEVKLGVDAIGRTAVSEDNVEYSPDMIVAGPPLRSKMQTAAKRHGLCEEISKSTMEMMSLAVRERLAGILESLKSIAAVRVESEKLQWETVAAGTNIREKLERMREDEERTLQVAAEMRVKRVREQKEAEVKRIAGEVAKSEKNSKDSSAAAEAERKEKLALEKKRKESSSQRDALSGLVRDRRRKRPTANLKPLAALQPLGKTGSLPPIPKRPSSESFGRGIKKQRTSLETLKSFGPLVKLGRANSAQFGTMSSGKDSENEEKVLVTLRDCIFLFESDRNTKKSTLLYKWYTRMQPGR